MNDFFLTSDIDEIITLLDDVIHDFSGKTLLLAGGRGFLGRYFIELFNRLNNDHLEKPCRLIGLDNYITAGESGRTLSDSEHVTFVDHDICKPLPDNLIQQLGPIDFVVHGAGIASPFYYQAHPLETLDVSIQGGRILLDLARQQNTRYTFFSSSEIYGDPDPRYVPTAENYRGLVACQGPRACYDEGKRVGETLTYIYHSYFGVCTNVIRPFNIYGPGMQETDYRALPNFGHQIKANRPLSVYGTGRQTRTFCYITDAMNGFLRVISRGTPGSAYNIGNPEPEISIAEVVQKIQQILEKEIHYNVIDYPDSYPADEPNRRCPDIRKAQLQLNYHPKISLEEGLKRFFSWTDKNYTGRII
ncbi:NAD-dependent epimerase/dehydratase family protein [Magnetococcales bacterium HHB-1]